MSIEIPLQKNVCSSITQKMSMISMHKNTGQDFN